MKKMKILGFVMSFFIITIILISGSEKKYEKKEYFNTTNDLLYYLETNNLMNIDNMGYIKETDELKECLSKRKRLSYSDFHYSRIKINEIVDLNEKEKNEILENYNNLMENYKVENHVINKIEPIRIKATVYNTYIEYIGRKYIQYDNEDKDVNEVTLVLIDEGEGFVIDYVVFQNKSE